jgi:hypothetical protein
MWWFVFYSRCTGIISRYTPTPSCERAGKGIVKSALVCRRIYICLDLSKTLYFCYANRFVCFSCWVLDLLWIDRIYVKNVNGVDWVRPILKCRSCNGLDPGSWKGFWLVVVERKIGDWIMLVEERKSMLVDGDEREECVLVVVSPSCSFCSISSCCQDILLVLIQRTDRVGSATRRRRPNKRIQSWRCFADIWSRRLFAYGPA